MFIEIVDSLRCPNDHAESWLVASCDVMVHRDIVTGRLGCPVCKAEYPIQDGAVWFDPPRSSSTEPPTASEDEALRIAAFLQLTDPMGFAILEGRWTAQAPMVAATAPTPLVLLNPTVAQASQPGISIVHCARRAPFAIGSARAVALDDPGLALADALKPGGRALGASTLKIPATLVRIAGDERMWIAEKMPAVVHVPLTVRARP